MRRLALSLCLVCAPAFAQPAPPQSPPATDLTKEFQAGIDAYRLGKYDDARAHLERARDMDPRLPGPYRFLAALGQAQGKWDDCTKNAYKALELNPKSSEAPDTRKLYEECRRGAGRTPYAQDLGDSAAIAVTANVTSATVTINSLGYGATPLEPRPITPGELEIHVEKQGWKPQTMKVNAIAGIVTDVVVDLEPDPAAQAEVQVEVHEVPKIGWLMYPQGNHVVTIDGKVAAPAERVELQPGTHVVEVQESGKDPWRRRFRITSGQKTSVQPVLVDTAERESSEMRGYYVIGAGAAFLAGGFVMAMVSRDAASDAREIARVERARNPAQPLTDVAPLHTRADLNDAVDKSNRFALYSNISYGVGLAAVGVGAYFIYKGGRESHDPPPFAVAPTHGGVFLAKELAW